MTLAVEGFLATSAHAQQGQEDTAANALYLTLGAGWAKSPAATLEESALPAIDIVVPLSSLRLPGAAGHAVGLRLEALEAAFGAESYAAPGSPYDGAEVYAATRSQSIGLQVTRPGLARLRPYAGLSVARVTVILDADDEKLQRQVDAGGLLRAGTYVAFSRGPTPFVLDLSVAYHYNGTRDYWRPGDLARRNGRIDLFELSVRFGIGSHR